jgi:hypothetical protein
VGVPDFKTVLLSVLISAVVSAAVSATVALATAGWVVQRQERSRARWLARRAVRDAVAPTLEQVRRYRANMSGGLRRDGKRHDVHGDDYTFATDVVQATVDLGRLRRALVLRRLQRIIGDTVELAKLMPADVSSTGSLFSPMLVWAYQRQKRGSGPVRPGLMQLALERDPNDPLVRRLEWNLRRLRSAR